MRLAVRGLSLSCTLASLPYNSSVWCVRRRAVSERVSENGWEGTRRQRGRKDTKNDANETMKQNKLDREARSPDTLAD